MRLLWLLCIYWQVFHSHIAPPAFGFEDLYGSFYEWCIVIVSSSCWSGEYYNCCAAMLFSNTDLLRELVELLFCPSFVFSELRVVFSVGSMAGCLKLVDCINFRIASEFIKRICSPLVGSLLDVSDVRGHSCLHRGNFNVRCCSCIEYPDASRVGAFGH